MGILSIFSKLFSTSKQAEERPQLQLKKLEEEELFIAKEATILIIDDSKTYVAACKKWLTDEGYNTLAAYDGREGIHQTKKKQPDLILMDIVMPEINGFQATRYLKKQPDTKHIPIILVSGEEQNVGRIWAKKLGACSFLVKPLKREQLLHLVNRVLEHQSALKVN